MGSRVSDCCCNRQSQFWWLEIICLLSYSSEGLKSEIEVSGRLFLLEVLGETMYQGYSGFYGLPALLGSWLLPSLKCMTLGTSLQPTG